MYPQTFALTMSIINPLNLDPQVYQQNSNFLYFITTASGVRNKHAGSNFLLHRSVSKLKKKRHEKCITQEQNVVDEEVRLLIISL